MSASPAVHSLPNAIVQATSSIASRSIVASPPAKSRTDGPSGRGPSSARKAAQIRSLDGEIRALARSIAQAAVEVLAGTRPVQQLSRTLDPGCLGALQHRAALTRAHAANSQSGQPRVHRSPMVRSVRVCAVNDGVYEASLVVSEELRSRAVAMRLEESNGAWKVTALEIG
ncbi:Rv3235 family protein [Arthrobacter sp. FW306-2-2C-D06B]|uniref:Rv3235 family protein n=1 Tax=Arthrobacter sp. FW306-2-2C-D06B TaxID=2879618 RepID=UPI001F391B84|nr:Rv3235 family protein [Arthrobacter sp. FW306-2-2C-D06B]UKA57545.1 Rv3235 family protein [Arthrobacter sp. FW306-2-2C-D06B]